MRSTATVANRILAARLPGTLAALALAAATLPIALAGCGAGAAAPRCTLLPGDLVFTEILSDPVGADAGQEWLEIYNATSTEVSLEGVTLELTTTSGRKLHVFRSAMAPRVPSHGHVAVGPGTVGQAPITYSYGSALGALPNSEATLILRCGSTELDRLHYGGAGDDGPATPAAGRSEQLSSHLAPDFMANDKRENWCQAKRPYGDGRNYGTPGAANDPCGSSGTTCDDGQGGKRPLRPPLPGELVVSEIFANTAGSEQSKREWVEVYVAASEPVDLLGVEFLSGHDCDKAYTVEGAEGDESCLTVQPGSYLVVGKSRELSQNGGVKVDFTYGGASLLNSDGCVGLQVPMRPSTLRASTPSMAPRPTWPASDRGPSPPDGSADLEQPRPKDAGAPADRAQVDGSRADRPHADGLRPDQPHADARRPDGPRERLPGDGRRDGLPDDGARDGGTLPAEIIDQVHYATSEDGASLSLDPAYLSAGGNDDPSHWCSGAAPFGDGAGRGTPGAANPACGVQSGCDHGPSKRQPVPPSAGDLVITEFYGDPAGADSPAKEWIEIYALRPFDLNGLTLQNTTETGKRSYEIKAAACVHVPAATYFVLGGSTDPAQNGGVTVGYAFDKGLTLYNSASKASLLLGDKLVDEASLPDPKSGASLSLDPRWLDPAQNDDPTHFCVAKTTGVFEGSGTPGRANEACGTP